MRALPVFLLLAACSSQPHQPLGPTLACVARTLGTDAPAPDVRAITQADMRDRFGPFQGYFTVASTGGRPTIWLVRTAARAVIAHEAYRAVAYAAGEPFTAEGDARARRACGRRG